jgi:hypothetical protein
MKTEELAKLVGRSRSQIARIASQIPGHRTTRGGHHYFTECPKLERWIEEQQQRRVRGQKRKKAASQSRSVYASVIRSSYLDSLRPDASPDSIARHLGVVGKWLVAVHRRMRSAEWPGWVKSNLPFSESAAYGYMIAWALRHLPNLRVSTASHSHQPSYFVSVPQAPLGLESRPRPLRLALDPQLVRRIHDLLKRFNQKPLEKLTTAELRSFLCDTQWIAAARSKGSLAALIPAEASSFRHATEWIALARGFAARLLHLRDDFAGSLCDSLTPLPASE